MLKEKRGKKHSRPNVTQEAPEFISNHGHTQHTTTYAAIHSDRNQENSSVTPVLQVTEKITLKWVGKPEVHSHHKPHKFLYN